MIQRDELGILKDRLEDLLENYEKKYLLRQIYNEEKLEKLEKHLKSHCTDFDYVFKNEKLPKEPNEIKSLSHLRRFFKCREGHDFEESVYNRTQLNYNCPKCCEGEK